MQRKLVIFAVGLALCQAGRASATGLNVSPVQVYLTKDDAKSQITVKNESEEPARFQLNLFRWDEDPAKGMKLEPSTELVFFPALLTLKAGEQRTVRVGALPAQFGLIEKTYRLFVEELPPVDKGTQRSQVRVLTRVGIPIFLAPSRKLDAMEVALRLDGKAVEADVKNGGNLHVRVQTVQLKAFDAKGEQLSVQEQQGWYVLANGHKPYRFELPEGTCAKARRLIVVARSDDERAFSQSLDTPQGTCPGK